MGRIEDVTIGELLELADDIDKPGLTILKWKILVKKFGTKHGLTDKEAVKLAKIAEEKWSLGCLHSAGSDL